MEKLAKGIMKAKLQLIASIVLEQVNPSGEVDKEKFRSSKLKAVEKYEWILKGASITNDILTERYIVNVVDEFRLKIMNLNITELSELFEQIKDEYDL